MPTLKANRIDLHYEEHPATDSSDEAASRSPLLLISGAGQGAAFWRRLVPFLTPHFRVITFDNRGFGASARPDVDYSVEIMAADARGLLDALEIEKAHLVGHSLGAALAFELGRSAPDRAASVTMISGLYPGPTWILPSSRALRAITRREGKALDLARRNIRVQTAPNFEIRHPDLFAELVDELLNRPQQPYFYEKQTRAGAAYLTHDRLDAPFQPSLCLIYGMDDELTRPVTAEAIRSRVLTAVAHKIPSAGHLLPLEKPAELSEIMKDFLLGGSSETSTDEPEESA